MHTPTRSMKVRFASALLLSSAVLAQEDLSRVAPPPKVDCPRDHLTSYTGEVAQYRRGVTKTGLSIRTDWGTVETVRIDHSGSQDGRAWFLIGGKTFEPSDWKRIEISVGQVRAGVRATAWVCDDGRNPIVEWLTPRE